MMTVTQAIKIAKQIEDANNYTNDICWHISNTMDSNLTPSQALRIINGVRFYLNRYEIEIVKLIEKIEKTK